MGHASPMGLPRAPISEHPDERAIDSFPTAPRRVICLIMQTFVTSQRSRAALPLLLFAVIVCGSAPVLAQTIELRRGLVITASARVAPRTYRLAAPDSSTRGRDHDSRRQHHGRFRRRLAGRIAPTMRCPMPRRELRFAIDGGRNVRILNAPHPRLQDRHPRARHARARRSPTTISATTGSRGFTASSSTRVCRLAFLPSQREGRVAPLRRGRVPAT